MAKRINATVNSQQLQLLTEQMPYRQVTQVQFAIWARRWLFAYHQGRIKDNTYQGTYWEPVELHLIPYFGDRLLNDILPIEITEFFKRAGKTLALETLKKIKACLNGIFTTAVENGMCLRNPMPSTLKLASKVPPKEKHTWSKAQYETAYDFARQHGRLDIMVLLETAITRSELLGLTWDDFDPDRQLLHLNNGLVQLKNSETQKVELVHEGLKNKYRHRNVPISKELAARLFLSPHVIYVGGSVRQHISPRRVETTHIFHAPHGGPYSPTNWYHREFKPFMRALCEEYPNIRPLTTHEFRHTRATLLKDAGKDIYSIARLLGHSNLDMLAKRYAHDNVDALRKALDIY